MTTKILLLFFLTLLFLLNGCKKQTSQQPKISKAIKVKTITIEEQRVPLWKTFTGKTVASSQQKIRARVFGVLKKIYFKDGSYVKKGAKLFQIEQESYRAALDIAKAKKAQDEAILQLTKADVARYKPLVKEGLAPRATLEQYEAKLASLHALILEDEAKIKEAALQLSYTTITAPISGYIGTRFIDSGNIIEKGQSTLLATIVRNDPLYAYFSPSQNELLTIQKYMQQKRVKAFIEYKGADNTIRLDGYVDFANNSVDPLTSTITMRAVVKNPHNKILPGTFVYVNLFITDKYKFKMIPPEAVMQDQLGKYLYIVGKNNKVKRVDITTGYETKYYVAVTQGLNNNDRVIISGLIKLKPGVLIQPQDVTQQKGIDAILKNNNLIPAED